MAIKDNQVREAPADEEETPIRKRKIKDYDFTSYCISRNLIKPNPTETELPEVRPKQDI